jgi:putative hydrolase of the HAD superfamily
MVRKRGYEIGLISNCGSDVPKVWEQTALAPFFDNTGFSCAHGVGMPAPEIYRRALNALVAEPAECMFVDDRIENLVSARDLGIEAIRLQWSDWERYHTSHLDHVRRWDGAEIGLLSELLPMLPVRPT